MGVTIDKDLSFNRYISQICEKVNKQSCVLKRYKNIITRNVMLRLYKAFILPHLQYCSLIWHFCGTRNYDKLESLNKRISLFIFNDSISSYDELLKKAKDSIPILWETSQNSYGSFQEFICFYVSSKNVREMRLWNVRKMQPFKVFEEAICHKRFREIESSETFFLFSFFFFLLYG